jgi:predicted nucleotidyltransferase
MTKPRIQLPQEKIAAFCRRHRIKKLSLFGSILREDFTASSDIDILVEFEPNAEVGLFDIAAMEQELSLLLGRKVDMRTAVELSRLFRDRVIDEAETQYVR